MVSISDSTPCTAAEGIVYQARVLRCCLVNPLSMSTTPSIHHQLHVSRAHVSRTLLVPLTTSSALCPINHPLCHGPAAKAHYGTSLANVDWLHGTAESLLTVTNLFIGEARLAACHACHSAHQCHCAQPAYISWRCRLLSVVGPVKPVSCSRLCCTYYTCVSCLGVQLHFAGTG